MKDTRIKNDIKVMWHILNEGAPYDIEGKDVSLYLITPFGKVKIDDFTMDKNVIHWTFFGKDQKTVGIYGLEMSINEDREGMVTTDKCKFVRLVAHSCMVGGADEGNVETETIELTSTLEYVAGGGSYDDTAIWAEVGRLENDKADKTELTELSAEVSGLSERIENLPSAESSVFEAVYDKTTFAEIVEAYNAGKVVTCRYGQTIAQLMTITDSVIYFTSINIKSETQFICYASNKWAYNSHNTAHELSTIDNGNVQVTIAGTTAEVATPQYVENLLGVIINGEY